MSPVVDSSGLVHAPAEPALVAVPISLNMCGVRRGEAAASRLSVDDLVWNPILGYVADRKENGRDDIGRLTAP